MITLSMLLKDKSGTQLSKFIDRNVQKTTGFFVKQGLNAAETASLLMLRCAAQNPRATRIAHTATPPISQLFAAVRRSSSILPLMAGKIAGKSTLLGFRLTVQSAKLTGRAITILCEKTKKR